MPQLYFLAPSLTLLCRISTICSSHHRVTVNFRGSVTGGKDWDHDLDFNFVKVPVTKVLEVKKLGEDLKLHRGFYSE
jgi:hypothetical protein